MGVPGWAVGGRVGCVTGVAAPGEETSAVDSGSFRLMGKLRVRRLAWRAVGLAEGSDKRLFCLSERESEADSG